MCKIHERRKLVKKRVKRSTKKMKSGKERKPVSTMTHLILPRTHLSLDVAKMCRSNQGYNYPIVAVDQARNCTYLVPIRSKSAIELGETLSKVLVRDPMAQIYALKSALAYELIMIQTMDLSQHHNQPFLISCDKDRN